MLGFNHACRDLLKYGCSRFGAIVTCQVVRKPGMRSLCQAPLPCPVQRWRPFAGESLGGVRGQRGGRRGMRFAECEMTQKCLFPERKPQERWMFHSSSLSTNQHVAVSGAGCSLGCMLAVPDASCFVRRERPRQEQHAHWLLWQR